MNTVISIAPVSVWDQKVLAARRWRRGEFNEESGKYFWSYRSDAAKSERWVTKEQLDHYRAYEKAKGAEWYSEHKDQHLTNGLAWQRSNKDKVRESTRKWRSANLEKDKASALAWRIKHKEHLKEKSRRYAKMHPDRVRAAAMKRISLKRAATISLRFVAGFYEMADRVGKCLGIAFEVDHIHPLSKGGSHCAENLQLLPKYWNIRKGNRLNFPLPSCYLT
jgi:5-methylcytosine-specific restriction endonuclease McrA